MRKRSAREAAARRARRAQARRRGRGTVARLAAVISLISLVLFFLDRQTWGPRLCWSVILVMPPEMKVKQPSAYFGLETMAACIGLALITEVVERRSGEGGG